MILGPTTIINKKEITKEAIIMVRKKIYRASCIILIGIIPIISIGCGKEVSKIPKELTQLNGGIIFIQNGEWRKYNLSTEKQLSFPLKEGLQYPIYIPNSKEILCKADGVYDHGIYKFSNNKIEKIYSAEVIEFCYIESNKILYTVEKTKKNYVLMVADLKSGKSDEIINKSLDFTTTLTSTHNTIVFSSKVQGKAPLKEYQIFKFVYEINRKPTIEFITKGNKPMLRLDRRKLAFLSNGDSELFIYDMYNNKTHSTGLKKVSQMSWIGDTNYLAYIRWISKFPSPDYLELGIVDCLTRETCPILKEGRGGLGYGLSWVDF
jgi:hypothetical protein